jgi:hypothetical protein
VSKRLPSDDMSSRICVSTRVRLAVTRGVGADGALPKDCELRISWSGFIKVCFRSTCTALAYDTASNKWRAIVYVNKKQVNLGYFPTKEESETQVGLDTTSHVLLHSKHHLLAPRMVHVTNLTPPGSDNPSRTYGGHQTMTASVVHVTNLTPPGSANPRRR